MNKDELIKFLEVAFRSEWRRLGGSEDSIENLKNESESIFNLDNILNAVNESLEIGSGQRKKKKYHEIMLKQLTRIYVQELVKGKNPIESKSAIKSKGKCEAYPC